MNEYIALLLISFAMPAGIFLLAWRAKAIDDKSQSGLPWGW